MPLVDCLTVSPEPQSGSTPEDNHKLRFMSAALEQGWPDKADKLLNEDIHQCLLWVASRSEDQIIADRESIIRDIERRGSVLQDGGAVEKWFKGSD